TGQQGSFIIPRGHGPAVYSHLLLHHRQSGISDRYLGKLRQKRYQRHSHRTRRRRRKVELGLATWGSKLYTSYQHRRILATGNPAREFGHKQVIVSRGGRSTTKHLRSGHDTWLPEGIGRITTGIAY